MRPDTHPGTARASLRSTGSRTLLFLALAACLLQAAGPLGAATVLVPTNSVWAFRKGTAEASEPATAWRRAGFADAAWPKGTAPFHYDTDGVYTGRTLLADMRNGYTSVYLRRGFTLAGAASVATLQVRFACDDGFVLWINGTRVAAHNQTLESPAFNAVATSASQEPVAWAGITVPGAGAFLVDGYNQVAVQAFNVSRTSSDFLFDLEITAEIDDALPPRIAAVEPPPGAVIGELRTVTVRFTEPVAGIGFTDLVANAQPATGLTGAGDTWTFTFDPPPPGPVRLTWDPGAAITDFASPPNRFDPGVPDAAWNYTVRDTTPPGIAAVSPPDGATVRELAGAEVRFSEPVAGVDAPDLLVDGIPALSVTGTGAGPYRFVLPQPAPGIVRLGWAADPGITDPSGNRFPGGDWSVRVDPDFVFEPVVINEILARVSGEAGLRDEDDEAADWIELHNRGAAAVNLQGWSLTDDPDDPARWIFPPVEIPAGGHLVVFATGKDRRDPAPGRRLHTNFRLADDGEYLGLFPVGAPRRAASEFAPAYPPQRADHSYGPAAANPTGPPVHHPVPTPGAPNTGPTVAGIVPDVTVNVARGFFAQPFTLHLACALPGAEIRYTTDGRPPTATTGTVYSGPLRIGTTTLLRAAAFHPGRLPSGVATHTYLFPDQVVRQPDAPPGVPGVWIDTQGRSWTADYGMDPEIAGDAAGAAAVRDALLALPSLSLVTAPADMFDNAAGIYPKSQARGPSWERPASVEFLFPGGDAVQADCGVQMQGNSVRDPVKTGKHAFRLVFKGDYGPRKLRLRVFPDSPLGEFDTLTVRADFNNSWMHWNGEQRLRGMRVRDAFMKDSFRAMGGLASHSRFFHLYVNGLYWGIYDPTERPDAAFAAAHLGGAKEDYDVMNEGQVVDGSRAAYDSLRGLRGVDTRAGYERVGGLLDIPAYADYVLLHFYTGHEDWFTDKNWYAIRRRAPGEGYRYLPWDGELMLNAPGHDITVRTDQPSGLHQKLLASAEYRLTFADRAQRHLFGDGALTPGAAAARYQRRVDEVSAAMAAESARWGDYRRDVHAYSSGPYLLYTVAGHFEAERRRLMTQYFPQRTATVLAQLRAAGLYPANAVAPSITAIPSRTPSGSPAREVRITAPSGTVYATTDGSDPRVPHAGTPSPSASVQPGPWLLDRPTVVRARTRLGGEWSALTELTVPIGSTIPQLAFTEVMYNPEGGDPYEYVELAHSGPLPLDVGGFSLEGIRFVFPPGTTLDPGQVVVLASDLAPDAFARRHPGVRVDGWFDGSLSNGGERLALRDAAGRIIAGVAYSDDPPWPAAADGGGSSLEAAAPGLEPDSPAGWRPSVPGGTPGRLPAPPPPDPVRLDEVAADNAASVAHGGGFPDWIELVNTGAVDADLSGWTLSDDGGVPFVFPAGTLLAAGERRVVWCGEPGGAAGLHTGFALARTGDSVILGRPDGTVADAVAFGPQLTDHTLVRDAAGAWVLGRPTPGTPADPVPSAPPSELFVNEWLADPPPGEPDWLEIHHRGADVPVDLRGLVVETPGGLATVRAPAFIAPNGFLVFTADGRPGGGNLPVRLPAAGGEVVLRTAFGDLLHRVAYGPQHPGITAGLLPDATGPQTLFPGSPTPGRPNARVTRDSVLLSEVLARPAPGGTPWLEVHNPGPDTVDLSGHRLTAGSGPPEGWIFPAGTLLAAGGHQVVDLDPARPASVAADPHPNAALAVHAGGDRLALVDPAGILLDEVAFGPQAAGWPVGRQSGRWQLLASPTPGLANAPAATLAPPAAGVRINEWMAAGPDDDWVELHNPTTRPVQLAGLALSDRIDLFQLRKQLFGPLSFLEAGGFLRIGTGSPPDPGTPGLGFGLADTGEVLVVSLPDGTVIDLVSFGPQAPGTSEGRYPDGTGALIRFTRAPTPGAPNLPDNRPPDIVPPVLPVLEAGSVLGILLEARDPDAPGTPLAWTLLEGPPGATLDPSTGALRWHTPASGTASSHPFRVRVSDNGVPAGTDELAFVLELRPTPPSVGATLLADDSLRLELGGPPGARLQLEASADLRAWEILGTRVLDGAPLRWDLPREIGVPGRFFRVRRVE